MIIDLNGEWNLNIKGSKETIKAIVPSSNYASLLNAKKIEDPFILDNEEKYYSISKENFIYKKAVTISEDILKSDRVYLYFEQIDTIATLYINGSKVFNFNDCHISYEIDIKDKIRVGNNLFEIEFESPVEYVNRAYKALKTPINSNGQNGICHIRKPQCHFGWDWGPVIPLVGITGNAYIKTCNSAKIEEVEIIQNHTDCKVELIINTKVERFNNKDIAIKYLVTCPNGSAIGSKAKLDNGLYSASILINNPELWWTKELSNKDIQPLYEVETILSSNGLEIERDLKRIGLRTLYLDRSEDELGKNFCFVLNGIKIFAKGANFIPPDSLINRYKNEDYDKLIDAVLFSNMNIIRVWGGGYIGSQYLYDKCDEKGILIWQDFPYACMGYPFFNEEFKSLCLKESGSIVKSTRHHASLAIYCGNNEIEQMSGLWLTMRKYIKSQEEFFYKDLKELVNKIAKDVPYIEGTPCGDGYLKHTNSDKISDTHIWAVWHGMKDYKYYRKRPTRFCSEFGFESFPQISTIRKFNGDEVEDFSSCYIQSHQKCNSGNDKIKYYIAKRFNLPKSFKEYIYLSQICQSECIRYGAEFWRQNKGKCNGAIYWQLNDCWPTSSWSSIDYYNNYKALLYSSKRFFNPISVSILDTKTKLSIYSVNDLLDDKFAQLNVKVIDLKGKTIFSSSRDVIIRANSSSKLYDINIANLKKYDRSLSLVAYASLSIDGIEYSTSILLNKEKKVKFIDPKIEKKVEVKDSEIIVTLKAKNYAHFVYVENSNCSYNFSDNFFSLMPGESKIIRQKIDKEISIEELNKSIAIFSAYNLSKGCRIKGEFEKLKVVLKPLNFVNYLFNR